MTVSAIDKSVFLGYTTNITNKHGDNMEQLTESNALFTYHERCRNAAKCYMDIKNKEDFDQEFLANTVAEFYQVEKVDMLAETNTQGR